MASVPSSPSLEASCAQQTSSENTRGHWKPVAMTTLLIVVISLAGPLQWRHNTPVLHLVLQTDANIVVGLNGRWILLSYSILSYIVILQE